MNSRGSSIYKNLPEFSVFGIGEYAFAKWKIAISGFYKSLDFRLVTPYEGKPTMLDDSSYYLSCYSEQEAQLLLSLLLSEQAQSFFRSIIFWDSKRPITIDLLKRLDLLQLATELGQEKELRSFLRAVPPLRKNKRLLVEDASQHSLF
jgi:hypothetical protein